MRIQIILFFLLIQITLSAQIVPLQNAHAHNDYKHHRPLLDALSHGFTSVEADVFLINGELYVYHDRPNSPDPNRTLKKMYLDPLAKIVRANGGQVYANYRTIFFLMIDIKAEGGAVYEVLRKQLLDYPDVFTAYPEDGITQGAVTVFLSGDRPFAAVKKDTARLVGIDGRPNDLGKRYSSGYMPVISDNFNQQFTWDGKGQMPDAEWKKLRFLVANAHAEGKRVRFWATPESPNVWKTLLRAQVDFINTDELSKLRQFLTQSN